MEECVEFMSLLESRSSGNEFMVGVVECAGESPKHPGNSQIKLMMAIEWCRVINHCQKRGTALRRPPSAFLSEGAEDEQLSIHELEGPVCSPGEVLKFLSWNGNAGDMPTLAWVRFRVWIGAGLVLWVNSKGRSSLLATRRWAPTSPGATAWSLHYRPHTNQINLGLFTYYSSRY